MPHGFERLRPTLSAGNDALIYALPADPERGVQLAQARVEPISVPRPQAFDTITIGVVTGRPLKLEFTVTEVKTREVVRDDLILGFENGGKVVLKDYMHAFGLLGDQRTTVIQPDGKHYAFTELLAPTEGPRAETPAPGTSPNVLIIQKPAPGETDRFKLTAEKPMALNFGMSDIARSEVDKDGNLVVTFKDRAVLVLEGYAALKGSADIALYFAKGDKIALADLAPGAGPDTGAEGGHLFTAFAPGGSIGPLDHLGPLGPEPFSLIPPPGPPGSPPPETPPPKVPPPPDIPPPHVDCKPPPKDCEPPKKDCEPPEKPVDCRPPPVCDPKPRDCDPDPKDHAKDHGKDHGDGHGKLTWVVAAGCDIGGDADGPRGRWGEHAEAGGKHARLDADAGHRGWTHGHDDAPHAQHMLAAHADPRGLWAHDDSGGGGDWHARGWEHAAVRGHDHDGGWSGDRGHDAHAHQAGLHDRGHDGWGGHESHGAPVSSSDVFDPGSHAAPAHAGQHGGGHFAAAHDFGAVTAHAENHAPQIQNHAQHNVMGH